MAPINIRSWLQQKAGRGNHVYLSTVKPFGVRKCSETLLECYANYSDRTGRTDGWQGRTIGPDGWTDDRTGGRSDGRTFDLGLSDGRSEGRTFDLGLSGQKFSPEY